MMKVLKDLITSIMIDSEYKVIEHEFSILFGEHIVVVEEVFHNDNKYDVENEIITNLAYIKKCSKSVLILGLGAKIENNNFWIT